MPISAQNSSLVNAPGKWNGRIEPTPSSGARVKIPLGIARLVKLRNLTWDDLGLSKSIVKSLFGEA